VWQTGQNIQQSWQPVTDVTAALGVNTRIVELAATTIQAEMVEFLLITENGTALNTIGQIRYANWWTIPGAVVWQKAVEVAVPFPAGRGKIVTAAGASDLNFVGQFMFVTADGHVWYAKREQSGRWDAVTDATKAMNGPANVVAVAAARPGPGPVHFMLVTSDGHAWYTRRDPYGVWRPAEDVGGNIGLKERVARVAAAPTPGVPGEVQFIFVTAQ
jgi:hypothetical protein